MSDLPETTASIITASAAAAANIEPTTTSLTSTGTPPPIDDNNNCSNSDDDDDVSSILNINVGVLGHVDSGKTSLVKAMSTLLSTASLDKSKQSRERGMTLDLGFSCFFVDHVPSHLQPQQQQIATAGPDNDSSNNTSSSNNNNKTIKRLQITLVDCPGHASLIRTIIGGAQIIDIVLLVVDAVKGWQAQTTECLVLAELCTSQIVIALNKMDSIPPNEREQTLMKVREQIQNVHLHRTRFANDRSTATTPMIGVSACVGGEKVAAINNTNNNNNNNKNDPNRIQNNHTQKDNCNDADDNNNHVTASTNENIALNGETATAPFFKGATTSGMTTAAAAAAAAQKNETMNIDVLISTLIDHLPIPQRLRTQQNISHNNRSNNINKRNGDTTPATAFYFAIDHCFPIRGRGTVITGTCISGNISVNDTIEFPTVSVERKVKSIQMFKRNVTQISAGDRAGICVSHFDATTIERSIAASPPGIIQSWKGAICIVKKVPFYPNQLPNHSKFHISVGHTTVMATVSFWGGRELATLLSSSTANGQSEQNNHFDATATTNTMVTVAESGPKSNKTTNNRTAATVVSSFGGSADTAGLPRLSYDYNQDYVYQDALLESLDGENKNDESNSTAATGIDNSCSDQLLNWAILDFQTPVHCPMHCLVIGSRLDTVDNATKAASSCRLAFSGRLIERIDPVYDAPRIRLYNTKEKHAVVSKLGDPYRRTDDDKMVRYEVFGSDLFKKETNMKLFIGMKLVTQIGEVGEIKSSFGTDGNFRVSFPSGTEAKVGDPLILKYKRYVHDATKAMHQDLELPTPRSGIRVEVVKKKPKKNEPGVNKFGLVDAIKGDILENGKHSMAIISGLFAPEINIKDRTGSVVRIPGTGDEGTIAGPFGKAGKCKVAFDSGISAKVGDKAELRL